MEFADTDQHQTIGLVEGWNRIMVERYLAKSTRAKAPSWLFAYGLLHECTIHNSFVPANCSMTPYEAMHGRRPTVRDLKPLFCVAYAHINKTNRSKFDPHAVKGRYLGRIPDWYPSFVSPGFQILRDDDDPHSIFTSRDVYFIEDLFDVSRTDPLRHAVPCLSWSDLYQDDGIVHRDTILQQLMAVPNSTLENNVDQQELVIRPPNLPEPISDNPGSDSCDTSRYESAVSSPSEGTPSLYGDSLPESASRAFGDEGDDEVNVAQSADEEPARQASPRGRLAPS